MSGLFFDPNDDRALQLQVQVVLEADWMKDGNCHRNPQFTDFFFSYDKGEVEVAQSICADCSVKSLCYAYALVYAERGVWGGTTQHERDERRPFVVEDVVELWPRLYARWEGRASEQEREQTPVKARESTGASTSPPALSEAQAARQRARDRSGEKPGEHVHRYDVFGTKSQEVASVIPLRPVGLLDAATDETGEAIPE